MRSRFIGRHCQNARRQQVANIICSTANNIREEAASEPPVLSLPSCLPLQPQVRAAVCMQIVAWFCCPDNSAALESEKWRTVCDVLPATTHRHSQAAHCAVLRQISMANINRRGDFHPKDKRRSCRSRCQRVLKNAANAFCNHANST